MTNPPDSDLRDLIVTPAQASAYALQAIEFSQKNQHRAMRLDVPQFGNYFAPMLPGQMCSLIAQTSNYKSAFMHMWERLLANQLEQEGRIDEAIIHISVEEDTEEQVFLEMANLTSEPAGDIARGKVQDWDRLHKAAIRIGQIPVYRLGESLARPESKHELTMSNMIASVDMLISGKVTDKPVRPAAIFFDYLQAFPLDPANRQQRGEQQRRLQVRDDVYSIRRALFRYKCPGVVGVQAKQELNNFHEAWRLPGMYDGEESAAIAQRSDRVMTLWLPKTTHPVGTLLEYKGVEFDVTENLLWVGVPKQRGGLPAGKVFKCYVDYLRNMILGTARTTEYETGYGDDDATH